VDAFDVLSARSASTDGFAVAPTLVDAPAEPGPRQGPVVPVWFAARRSMPRARAAADKVTLPASTRGKCVLTGAHVMAVEPALQGMKSVEGVCRGCGLVKRYPATAAQARRTRSGKLGPSDVARPVFDPSTVAPLRSTDHVDWALAFDVMCHVGAGPISSLDRIAAQIDPTPLFADELCRRLEALGHIEVRRDPLTLGAVAWEVTDPTLVGVSNGEFVLTGFRSTSILAELRRAAGEVSVTIAEDVVDAPSRVRIVAPGAAALGSLADAIARTTDRSIRLVPRAAETLAAGLPAFTDVLGSLSVTSAIGGGSIERWDPEVARFVAAAEASAPGAYRIVGRRRIYVYRRPRDIARMEALLGDARVVKYAAAIDSGRSLIGYSPEHEVLYVPLGADLPGLYGRAAVLASGRPPHENDQDRLLEYHRVSPELAHMIIERLTT
jgi:hypothetical protein